VAKPQLTALEDQFWGLSGDLTFATVGDFLPQFDELIANTQGCAQFDLGKVERADSAGLALLLEGIAIARRKGCQLGFRNLPDNLQDLAQISNVEGLLSSP
jgi:phospholipid transport system transporter-binding protein